MTAMANGFSNPQPRLRSVYTGATVSHAMPLGIALAGMGAANHHERRLYIHVRYLRL